MDLCRSASNIILISKVINSNINTDTPKNPHSSPIVQKIKSGEGIGSPFLSIEIPDGWEEEPADFSRPTVVTGHEGRHRMHAIRELEGDVPVEVHLWGRFEGSELRRKYMTDKMFDELEKGLISETGQYIVNPFLSIQR